MANLIEVTDIKATTLVDNSSRYSGSTVLRYSEQGYLTFETYKRNDNIVPESPDDQFTLLSAKYEYRPDLLSYDVYGFPDYWWKIMQVNNIWDVFEFTAGKNIRIPQKI